MRRSARVKGGNIALSLHQTVQTLVLVLTACLYLTLDPVPGAMRSTWVPRSVTSRARYARPS